MMPSASRTNRLTAARFLIVSAGRVEEIVIDRIDQAGTRPAHLRYQLRGKLGCNIGLPIAIDNHQICPLATLLIAADDVENSGIDGMAKRQQDADVRRAERRLAVPVFVADQDSQFLRQRGALRRTSNPTNHRNDSEKGRARSMEI